MLKNQKTSHKNGGVGSGITKPIITYGNTNQVGKTHASNFPQSPLLPAVLSLAS